MRLPTKGATMNLQRNNLDSIGVNQGRGRRSRSEAAASLFEARLRELAAPRLAQEGFNANALARLAAMSPRTLQLHMRKHALPTPAAWLRGMRLARAQALLKSGQCSTVGEVAAEVGLSRSYFCRLYHAQLGHPPGEDLWKVI